MRWISLRMACESAWPTLGSRASCISRSSVILRSQSWTWRSASSTSCVSWPRSPRALSTARSMSRHWPSTSRSFCTNSASSIWFEFESSLDRSSLFTASPFMRSMSKRRRFVCDSSSRISRSCAWSWPSTRTRFCSRTMRRFRWSASWPLSRSVSAETPRSWVCFWIQSFCMSEHSLARSWICFRVCFRRDSWGPATSASPASASSFVLRSS
mmetsp:Transcript_21336/g.61692  ORF Transcript_21336/g.61692 Transcript_21336/m.61692 type:complete len:212 (-) Transcript_21336:1398-2033(-)